MQNDPDKQNAAGGGCLVFVGFLIGSAVGIAVDQPSIGVLVGVAVGTLLAVILWLIGRRRDA